VLRRRGIVADVEGREKIPEMSRVQGPRPPTERQTERERVRERG